MCIFQVYVDQVDKDIVSVTRHNPVNHQSVILIARTAFNLPPNMDTGYVPPLCVPGKNELNYPRPSLHIRNNLYHIHDVYLYLGVVNEIVMEARVAYQTGYQPFKQDANFLNGLTDHVLHIREHIKVGLDFMQYT